MFSVIRMRNILSTFSCDTQRSVKLCRVWLMHAARISTLVWHISSASFHQTKTKRKENLRDNQWSTVKPRAKDKPVKQNRTTTNKDWQNTNTYEQHGPPMEWERTLVLRKSKQFLSIATHMPWYPCAVVVKSDEWEMNLQQLLVSCNLGNIHLITFNNLGATDI